MKFDCLENSQNETVDVFLVTVPWTDSKIPLMAPAALLPIIEKAGFECEIFNVASGTSISIDNLAKDFVKAGNFSNTVNFSDQEREGDPKFWRADISKLSALGYNAGTSIIEGLKETIKWMKENE